MASSDSTSIDTGDGKDQEIAALIEAIALLSKLAAMSPEGYEQETFMAKSKDIQPSDYDTDGTSSTTTIASCDDSVQSRIDGLHAKWSLEDTAIPHLTDSIHRLQSNLILVQREADSISAENLVLQMELSQLKSRQKGLEHTVRKLSAENDRLRKTIVKMKQKPKVLMRKVENTVLKKREKGGKLNIGDWQADPLSPESSSSSPPLPPPPPYINQDRQRSDDSLFSEIDEPTDEEPHRNYNYDRREMQDDSSISSCSSAPLVTDAKATISLKATYSFPPLSAQIDSKLLISEEMCDDESSHIYLLRFPVGRRVGLELQKVPLDYTCNLNSNDSITAERSNPEEDSSAHSTTFVDVAADVSVDVKGLGSLISNVGNALSGFAVDITSHHGSEGSEELQQRPDSAFLICGYAEFDPLLNKRPPMGSRLIAIDDISLEKGVWSFAKLHETILQSQMTSRDESSSSSMFSMKFRADPLTERQRYILDKAIDRCQRKARVRSKALTRDDAANKSAKEIETQPLRSEVEDKTECQTAQKQKAGTDGSSHCSRSNSDNNCRMQEQNQRAMSRPPPPGPEEVKRAILAFSTKLKGIA